MTKQLEKNFEATEMCFLRQLLRMSWTEKKSNDGILRIAYKIKKTVQNHEKTEKSRISRPRTSGDNR